jgi:hypothetical protein
MRRRASCPVRRLPRHTVLHSAAHLWLRAALCALHSGQPDVRLYRLFRTLRRIAGPAACCASGAQVPDPRRGPLGVLARGRCASPNTYPPCTVAAAANIPPPGQARCELGIARPGYACPRLMLVIHPSSTMDGPAIKGLPSSCCVSAVSLLAPCQRTVRCFNVSDPTHQQHSCLACLLDRSNFFFFFSADPTDHLATRFVPCHAPPSCHPS